MNLQFKLIEQKHESILFDMLFIALFVPPSQPNLERKVLNEPRIKQYAEKWGRPGDEGFLAFDDKKPIGAAWIRLWPGETKGFGYIDDLTPEITMAMLPEYRGQGIGTKLLLKLIGAMKLNYKKLCLSVHNENPAKRFYEKVGFKLVKDDKKTSTMIKYL